MKETMQSHRKPGRRQPGRAARNTAKSSEANIGEIMDSRNSSAIDKSQVKSRASAAEQAQLLGLNGPLTPTTPTSTKSSKGKSHGHGKKKYMDDILEDNIDEEIKRGKRWIPDLAHRKRPNSQPLGVPFALWTAYKHLDDYMYRHSLSNEDLEALPLLEDVHQYQDSDGKLPQPITPPGFQWDENLELVPLDG
ncbi:hypothetical protein F5B22DRAFT_662540 [Xylaria bambusicola]|uniref:uncharacterized protein n=1 Tax=Xylaria bambusicola TaxID=326684 RepID=UPI002007BE39|nr:uncharacterized protein F5B22DRAFT_662540 [Xylaria bambusicola]KAI0521420.1 hypothetical protein F5B22DRAFT_662540 [Xylaria bambusicola]